MLIGNLFRSIYTRMVVTLLVAVIPFYLIVLQINRSDAAGVRDGVAESIGSQAHYYLSSLESELAQVIKFQQQLSTSAELDTLANASEIMTNEEKRQAVLSIQRLIIAAVSYVIYRLVHHPLRKFIVAFRQVGNGNFGVSIERSSKDEFAYLYRHFNQTVRKLQELVYEVYEQKYRTQHAELKQLQSQINPHFLYNGFFTIYRMAKFGENDNVARFAKYLGEYYRFITRDGAEEVTVRDEAAHARTYADIQLFRFHDRISVRFGDIPETLGATLVPRLTLQPVIENAFVHALENRAEGGYLEVAFSHAGDEAIIAVEDNGTGLDDETLEALRRKLLSTGQSGETTGMSNVHRRLQLRFGANAGLRLSRSPLGGLKAEIAFPAPSPNR